MQRTNSSKEQLDLKFRTAQHFSTFGPYNMHMDDNRHVKIKDYESKNDSSDEEVWKSGSSNRLQYFES